METNTIETQELARAASIFQGIKTHMARALVGQDELIQALSLALVCGQHVLLEGVPGLAKTLAVRTLGDALGLEFKRIQFTPDLLPSDLVGTLIFQPQKGDFSVKKGPVFANLVLADEINRAPAKVQSALLESMEERQVTLGDETYGLPRPFMVLATQNPIEQEGTYPLPEAQLDRFMFKITVSYPDRDEELAILRLKKNPIPQPSTPISESDIEFLGTLTNRVHLDPRVEEYIVDLVRATRNPQDYGLSLENTIRWGAGPRAVIFLLKASQALALWHGRSYVVPEDVQFLVPWILRHRVLPTYEAMAEGLGTDEILARLVQGIPAP